MCHEFQLSTTEQPPSYRDFHTATVLDNKMYIFGGRGDRHSPFHTQEEIYCDQLVYLVSVSMGSILEELTDGRCFSSLINFMFLLPNSIVVSDKIPMN